MGTNESSKRRGRFAFTMVEMLIVIAIAGVLTALAFPAFTKMKRMASDAVSVSGLKQVVVATGLWAADHGGKLPSPKYTGDEKDLPLYWTTATSGEDGLWLKGVVFAQVYAEEPEPGLTVDQSISESFEGVSNKATDGKHLVGTVFESKASVTLSPEERDWYRHTYAMNANLMYDELATLSGVADPWLTEKAISKFEPSAAMVYVDCIEKNIVMAEDYSLLVEAAEKRYEDRFVLVAYLDGHVAKVHPSEIPSGNPEVDREASLFWRGLLPKH